MGLAKTYLNGEVVLISSGLNSEILLILLVFLRLHTIIYKLLTKCHALKQISAIHSQQIKKHKY